jgi:hypothetical protein
MKLRVAGFTVTTGVAAPVPPKLTIVGSPLALWAIETDALLLPELVGVNVTLIVQLLPAATLEQVLV